MEKHETFSAKGRRKKVQIGLASGGGVCNIGGIVLWGGALAAVSFAAAFAVRRGRRRDANEKNCPLRKEDQASGFVFRISSPSFGCDDPRCSSNELKTQMIDTQVEVDSCQLESTKSLILEENVSPATHCRNESFDAGNQEILPATYSEVASIKLCNDNAGIENFSFPVIVQEDRIKDDLKVALMETYEVLKEEEAVDAVGTNIEEPSLVNLVEQVENGSEDEDREGHTIKFTKSLILEDNVLRTTHCGKESYNTGNLEILPADGAEGHDIKLCDAGMTVEGFSFPSVEPENRVENDLVVKELPLEEIMEVKSNVFPLIETIEVIKEEEAVDAVNIEKLILEHLVEVENDGDDDDIVNVAEDIRDDETEETKDASKICIGKISSMIVKEDDDNEETVKEAPLMERDEAWNDEKAINDDLEKTTDINSSVHPIEEEETEFRGLMEKINLGKVEEEIVVLSKVTTKLTSLTHSVEAEVDKYSGKQSTPSERTEFSTGEKTSEINVNVASSLLSTKETEDEEDEDEPIVEKGEEESEETGSTSAGSRAEKIWPKESIEALAKELAGKVREEDQDRTTKTGEHNSKTNNFENQGHGYQTPKTPIFLKKVKTLVIDLPTILTKWKISIRFILVLALTVLFLFSHQHALYYMFTWVFDFP